MHRKQKYNKEIIEIKESIKKSEQGLELARSQAQSIHSDADEFKKKLKEIEEMTEKFKEKIKVTSYITSKVIYRI